MAVWFSACICNSEHVNTWSYGVATGKAKAVRMVWMELMAYNASSIQNGFLVSGPNLVLPLGVYDPALYPYFLPKFVLVCLLFVTRLCFPIFFAPHNIPTIDNVA